MSDPFVRLEERVAGLGNHHRRYLRNISVHKDALIDRLESLGQIDQVHLWSASPDLANEMDTVGLGSYLEIIPVLSRQQQIQQLRKAKQD